MRYVAMVILAFLSCACASNPPPNAIPTTQYCDPNINIRQAFAYMRPEKYEYVVTRSVKYSDEVANHMREYLFQDMSMSVFAEIASRIEVLNDDGDVQSQFHHSLQSNLILAGVKFDYLKHNDCMIGIALMNDSNVNTAFANKEILDKEEERDWAKINNSIDVSDYLAHIESYPLGNYRRIAQTRVEKLTDYYRRYPYAEFEALLSEHGYDERRFRGYGRSTRADVENTTLGQWLRVIEMLTH